MVKRTKVMLIWPWSQQHQRTLELFPIGLGYLVNNIDPTFFEVKILDCALDNLHPSSNEFRQALRDFQPEVLGVSWWSVNTPIVEETLRVAREEFPSVVLIAGGPHVTGRGETIVGCGAVHYAFHGEAERGTSALLATLREHGLKPPAAELATIPGLIYRDAFGVKKTGRSLVENLDEVVGIDYELLRLREYHKIGYYYGAKLQKKDELTAPIMTARGCPFKCAFCMAPTIDGRRIRRHSLERVVKTVRRLYEDFGVRYIAIIDDNFTINTRWALKVCNAIADMKLEGLAMGTPNGIPLAGMNEELAKAMKHAGWREVMIAPESGSPRTLRAMNKPVHLEHVPKFISLFHNVGLQVSAFFIIGYPEETLEDIALTKRFIFDNEFDFVGISIYQPLPGTAIYDRLVAEGTIPQGFIPGHYQEVTFKRRGMDSGVLCDEYNRLWNEYRERRGMPIRNRAVASVREQLVVSSLA